MNNNRPTDHAIKLYRQIVELLADPTVDQWEEGKRRQYLDTCDELHTLLGRKPWETCVSDTIGEDVPPVWLQTHRISDWLEAQSIRCALDREIAA